MEFINSYCSQEQLDFYLRRWQRTSATSNRFMKIYKFNCYGRDDSWEIVERHEKLPLKLCPYFEKN
jgi:hypothetical protein